jgi:hypothetical protein
MNRRGMWQRAFRGIAGSLAEAMLMTEPLAYAEYRRLGSQMTATASISTRSPGSDTAAMPTSVLAVSGRGSPKTSVAAASNASTVSSLVEANVLAPQ